MSVPVRRLARLGGFAALVAASALVFSPPTLSAQDNGGDGVVPSLLQGLDYRMVGPTRGGRVTAVAGHRSHPSTFYMGASGGGVWKTDDWGAAWHNVSDGFFHTGSIGAIRVAESAPDIVYVGTGSDGLRSNVIVGTGMYRSDDAGESWTHLGLEDAGQIGAVVIHPTDPELVYVAALGNPFGKNEQRGVFRSRNGGQSWDKVLFTSDSVGGIDIEMHPTDPNTLYASMWRGERKPWTIISGMEESGEEDGIWKSTDGGDTWRYIHLDLPSGLIGKIDFAVSAAEPDRVYALVETKEPAEGLYRSGDRGETWELVSNHEPLMDRPFYYTNVDADPTDADLVYVSATQFWKSTDGGESFRRRSTPHGDNHDLWINPDDPRIMVQSNDGGANVTRDGGDTWSTQMNQPTAELYQVNVDDQFPYWLYAGQQDNSTIMVPADRPAEASVVGPEGWWKDVGGCETGPVVPKPGDPTVVWANCKGRFGRYSHLTGQAQQYYVGGVNMYGTNPENLPFRFQRVVPIEASSHDPDIVYHGSQYVHKTTNGGRAWEQISPDLTAFISRRQIISGGPITRDITGEEHYSTLYVIEESPYDADVIWTGANDGPVHVTRDGGASWTEVTPPDMPPEGRINSIDVSPFDPAGAYVAGYRTLLGDFTPYMYRTDDYGESWTRITDGIPSNHPARVLRADPEREGLLYAGTEFGMFVSFDDGTVWQPFQLDLPVTPITDIRIKDGDLVVATMGRGFWILDDLSPVRQIDQASGKQVHLFQPADVYRTRGGGFYGFGGSGAVEPEYPGAGVRIDYHLAEQQPQPITLEILDARGRTVRIFESEGLGEATEEAQEMRGPFQRRSGQPTLGDGAGAHRFVWDLTYPGPGGGRGGPMAVPGSYQVRLSVAGETRTREVEVMIDPRVEADGVTLADLQAQFDLAMEMIETMETAEEVGSEVRAALREVGDAGGDARAREILERLRDQLFTREGGSYQRPMLIAQLRYLYGMISRADQPPGQDAYDRHRELRSELEEIREELERARRMMADGSGVGEA